MLDAAWQASTLAVEAAALLPAVLRECVVMGGVGGVVAARSWESSGIALVRAPIAPAFFRHPPGAVVVVL